jgi:hypothetical protein
VARWQVRAEAAHVVASSPSKRACGQGGGNGHERARPAVRMRMGAGIAAVRLRCRAGEVAAIGERVVLVAGA